MSAGTRQGGIDATRTIPVERAALFDFLSDLENHWLLAGRLVEVLELEGPEGARTGGRIRMRGPLGLGRTARTTVRSARAPKHMEGRAELGTRTTASVRWTLTPASGCTEVELAARVERAAALDRILLALGGGAWLRRLFTKTLYRLEELAAANGGKPPRGSRGLPGGENRDSPGLGQRGRGATPDGAIESPRVLGG
jgi:uncharacterized protein YndB with AHSA1/START domain